MNTYVLVAAGVGFVAGNVSGLYLKDKMPTLPTWRPRRPFTRDQLLIVLVVISLLGNALVGALYVHGGKKTNATARTASTSAAQVKRLAKCNALYNLLDGKARDERAIAAKPQLRSEIRLWRELGRQIAAGTLTQTSITRSIDEHVKSLEGVRSARFANPYPPNDYCLGPNPPTEDPAAERSKP